MKDQLRILITVLKLSVEKHGVETPLTIGHLLNICKMAQRYADQIDVLEDLEHGELLNEITFCGQT